MKADEIQCNFGVAMAEPMGEKRGLADDDPEMGG